MGNSGNPHPKGSQAHENWNIKNDDHIRNTGSDVHGTSFPHKKGGGGGGNGGCFPAECMIRTPIEEVPIESLKKGDFVLAYENDNLVPKRILKTQVYQRKRLVELSVDSTSLMVTMHHTLTVNGDKIAVKHIKRGDEVMTVNGPKRVKGIKTTDRVETVYNLVVEDQFNFVADGCIAESFTTLPWLSKLFWNFVAKTSRPATERNVISAPQT